MPCWSRTGRAAKSRAGLAAYNASDAERIAGKRTVEIEAILGYRGRDEMIHRDDLVADGKLTMTVHKPPMRLAAEMMAIGAAAREAARAMREAGDDDQDQGADGSRRAPSAPRKPEILAANARRYRSGQSRRHGRAACWTGWRSMMRGSKPWPRAWKMWRRQPDPNGRELARWTRPNGLDIARVATPIGVIGIIYESRPNVTADAGAIALKAGNVAILRGGSDSIHSSGAIHAAMAEGLEGGGPARSRHPICEEHRPRRGGPDAGRA